MSAILWPVTTPSILSTTDSEGRPATSTVSPDPADSESVPPETPLVSDPGIPVELLLSRDSRAILDALLGEVGARTSDVKPVQVRYVPGRSVIVQYQGDVEWTDHTSKETLVIASGVDVPEATLQLEVDDNRMAVWRYPRDPFLPGLEAAADPTRVTKLLTDLGSPQQATNLRRRAYRPGRRAVIEAVAPSTRIFVKVVRPDRIAKIQSKHVTLAGQVPVPHSYGWSADLGLIALQAMAGKTLRSVLESGSRNLPGPEQILGLLDALPMPADDDIVAGPVATASGHARLLRAIAPDLSGDIEGVVEAVAAAEDDEPVPVHGDFHSSQILVRGDHIVGLVDVDSAGAGLRADDLAGLLGHLATLSLTSSKRKGMSGYGTALIEAFDKQTDPRSLRLRTAAVILGLATGPFRVQENVWPAATKRRIELATEWVDIAASSS